MITRQKLYAAGEPFGDSCTRIEAGRAIYGGGGGSSSSTSASSTATTNVDKRQVVDGGSTGVTADSSTINVTTLDNGAVNSAIGLVGETGNAALDAYKTLLSTTVILAGQAEKTIQSNSDLAAELAKSATGTSATAASSTPMTDADKKKYMAIAAVAAVIYIARKKG